MRLLTVALVDGNPSLLSTAKSFFYDDKEINLLTFSELSELKDLPHVDVIVFDVALTLLDKLPDLRCNYTGIATTSVLKEEMLDRALHVGAEALLYKPFEMRVLREKILSLNTSLTVELKPRSNIDERLSNIFIRAGIPPHIKGYQFLREAVKLSIASPEMINNITKQLYPTIANRFNTSASKVERAIRHAIEVAWNRGKIENINSIFSVKIYSKGEKPTNGELIALIADKLLVEGSL